MRHNLFQKDQINYMIAPRVSIAVDFVAAVDVLILENLVRSEDSKVNSGSDCNHQERNQKWTTERSRRDIQRKSTCFGEQSYTAWLNRDASRTA